jgi:hypothetical protein
MAFSQRSRVLVTFAAFLSGGVRARDAQVPARCDLSPPIVASANCTLGRRLDACLAALPADGGVCDAILAPEPRTLDSPLRVARPGATILLGAYRVTLVNAADIQLVAQGATLRGLGQAATFIDARSGCAIRVGLADTIVRRWRVEGMTVRAVSDKATCGLSLSNAREGVIRDVQVSNFNSPTGSGVTVLSGSWANTSDQLYATQNRAGLVFSGKDINAWAVRGGYINRNTIGVLFDLGKGSAQGIAFGPGVIFENNVEASIRVKSGHVLQLGIEAPYAEAYKGQKFIEVRGENGVPVAVDMLYVAGGFIYSDDQPAFSIDASGSDADSATIMATGVYIRASNRGPIAVLSGKRATGTFFAPTLRLPTQEERPVLKLVKEAMGAIVGGRQ